MLVASHGPGSKLRGPLAPQGVLGLFSP
jgi:hypothetical protein